MQRTATLPKVACNSAATPATLPGDAILCGAGPSICATSARVAKPTASEARSRVQALGAHLFRLVSARRRLRNRKPFRGEAGLSEYLEGTKRRVSIGVCGTKLERFDLPSTATIPAATAPETPGADSGGGRIQGRPMVNSLRRRSS